MNYRDFEIMVENNVEHETIYLDSGGRTILVIRLLDAFGLVTRAVQAEREECAKLCEQAYEGYDWADREKDGAEACAAAIRKRGAT